MKNRLNERFDRIRAWLIQGAGTKRGSISLALCSFSDASLFPFPVNTYFLLMVILNKQKTDTFILVALLGTLAGALAGYMIGDLAWIKDNGDFTVFSTFIFNNVQGFTEIQYDKIRILFNKWDIWILATATITPIPYGLISVFAGALEINVLVFMITTAVCQFIKFLLLGKVVVALDAQVRKLRFFGLKAFAGMGLSLPLMMHLFQNGIRHFSD
jgi:membrane protein YqaA with SNARE-associated domain